jgi:hypothetical protein
MTHQRHIVAQHNPLGVFTSFDLDSPCLRPLATDFLSLRMLRFGLSCPSMPLFGHIVVVARRNRVKAIFGFAPLNTEGPRDNDRRSDGDMQGAIKVFSYIRFPP